MIDSFRRSICSVLREEEEEKKKTQTKEKIIKLCKENAKKKYANKG
jgi:hypothetical protein